MGHVWQHASETTRLRGVQIGRRLHAQSMPRATAGAVVVETTAHLQQQPPPGRPARPRQGQHHRHADDHLRDTGF